MTTTIPNTLGKQLLTDWFGADDKRTRAGLGERLGITGQAVGGWLRGISRPDERMRVLLEHATGISADAWATDEERASLERGIARARGLDEHSAA